MRFLPSLGVLLAAAGLQAADFNLLATPATVAWGYYSQEAKPVLTVHSGDTVRIQTASSCPSPARMEAAGVAPGDIPQYERDIYEQVKDKGPGGHILTGPVAIAEAQPGDVLEVKIEKIDIDAPFACNSFGPGRGFLAERFSLRPHENHSA